VTLYPELMQYPPMFSTAIKRAQLAWCLGAGLLAAGPVQAGLGLDAASVRADAAELAATTESTEAADYIIAEIESDSGMRIREFSNRAGVIFAVAWSGPAPPNLQRLLGAHFADFAAAVSALDHPGRRRSLRVSTQELVVEIGGHLRAYAGRAYLPRLIPAGVSAVELR
jgi:hypothetical protein